MSEPEAEAAPVAQTLTVETLANQLTHLQERVDTLQTEIERKDERIAGLEEQVADQQARLEAATRNRKNFGPRSTSSSTTPRSSS